MQVSLAQGYSEGMLIFVMRSRTATTRAFERRLIDGWVPTREPSSASSETKCCPPARGTPAEVIASTSCRALLRDRCMELLRAGLRPRPQQTGFDLIWPSS